MTRRLFKDWLEAAVGVLLGICVYFVVFLVALSVLR